MLRRQRRQEPGHGAGLALQGSRDGDHRERGDEQAEVDRAVREAAPRIFDGPLLKPVCYMEHGYSPATMRRGVSLGRLYPAQKALHEGLVVAVTETCGEEDIETLASALREVLA